MTATEFWRPRFRGGRFEQGAIPLEVLGDLAVLRRLVIDVARSRFLKQHPERQRSPKGFGERIQLSLAGVEDGSAVAVISLDSGLPRLPGMPVPYHEYFDQARESILSAVAAAAAQKPPAEHLSPGHLAYFARFGQSLRDGETVEFPRSGCGAWVPLSPQTRRRLVEASSRSDEMLKDAAVVGSIPEADQKRMTFQLEVNSGRRVQGEIPEPQIDAVIEAFGGYRRGTKVQVRGFGAFDRNDRLLRLEQVENIAVLDPLDIAAQLPDIRILQDGWLDGEGIAPPDAGLDWLAARFDRHYADDLALPHLYPMPNGGVAAEWSFGVHEATVEFDLAARTGAWHLLDTGADTDEEELLNLERAEAWERLCDAIRRLGGANS